MKDVFEFPALGHFSKMASNIDPVMDEAFFRGKTVTWITDFLKARGISVDGRRKEDLVKLCVFAAEENLDVVGTIKENEHQFQTEHQNRLLVGSRRVPEPDSLPWSLDLSLVPVINMAKNQ